MNDTLKELITLSELETQAFHPLFTLNKDHQVEDLSAMNMWTWFLDTEQTEEAVYVTLTYVEETSQPIHVFCKSYDRTIETKEAMHVYGEKLVSWLQEHPRLRLHFVTHDYQIHLQTMIDDEE